MEVNIEWHGDQFNVKLSSRAGEEEFLSVKGCRLVDGSKGAFVSWPATKNQTSGKYWQHVWASERFAAVVLAKAQETMPRKDAPRQRPASRGDDLDAPPF